MLRVIGREATSVLATLLGLLMITFLIGRVVPIDPVLAVVGDKASPDVYAAARVALGLDQPVWRQFAIYVGNILRDDFGVSVLSMHPVMQDIAHVFPATAELATLGLLIGAAGGIPLGILAAVYQGRWPDLLARFTGLLGYSIPVFWLGLMGLLVFYGRLGWVGGPGASGVAWQDAVDPITGVLVVDAALEGEWGALADAVSHLVMPAVVLGLVSLAYISRMMRSFMVTELRQPYVITARVKGVPEWRVVLGHAARNAAVPLIMVLALSYAQLLEGSVLVETVFAWPGLGRYITTALLNADMNAVLGGTLVVGVVFIGVNLLADVAARLADPRFR